MGSERESFGFLAQQSWQSCQNCIPCDQSNFWIKLNFFSKKIALLIFFRILAKNFHVFRKRFRRKCRVRNLRVRKVFREKLDEPGRLSTCPAERSTSREKFGRNQIFLTYGQWEKNCWFLSEKFYAELLTPLSICPEKNFETKVFFFLKKYVWRFFRFRMKKFWICGRSFQQGVKNKIHVTRRSFW